MIYFLFNEIQPNVLFTQTEGVSYIPVQQIKLSKLT